MYNHLAFENDMLKAFPPVASPDARLVILGSMPGIASLQAARYYAHPRNAFWPVMAALTGVSAEAPYAERLAGLMRSGIALWDVLHACEREGSLDAAIVDATSVPNDFAAFSGSIRELRRYFSTGRRRSSPFGGRYWGGRRFRRVWRSCGCRQPARHMREWRWSASRRRGGRRWRRWCPLRAPRHKEKGPPFGKPLI